MNPSLRFRVLTRDLFTCRYCGATPPDVKLQVDHIVPRSRGGLDVATNLVTACAQCNGGKSDTLLDEQAVALVTPTTPLPEKPKRRYVPRRPAKKRKPAPPLPVSLGMPYIGPDEPATTWRCANCGMVNSLEGDGCHCDSPRTPRFDCFTCNEEIDELQSEEYDGMCEECYSDAHRECLDCEENDRQWGSDYCQQCDPQPVVAVGGYE